MEGLYFLAPTLLAILISMLFVRAGAIALMMTGMHYEQAKFQALSSFTGTGFTTREAERVVNHPKRRKIISYLMIGGYAGVVTVIVSATSTLAASSAQDLPRTVLLLALGVLVIYLIARSTGLMQRWENLVESYLRNSFEFEYAPIEELLHLAEGYGLVRLEIGADSPFLGKSIVQIGKTRRDTLIIGIERGRTWLPARLMKEELKKGDQLVLYGLIDRLKEEYQDKEAAEAEKAEIEKAAAEEAAVEKAEAEKAAAEKAKKAKKEKAKLA